MANVVKLEGKLCKFSNRFSFVSIHDEMIQLQSRDVRIPRDVTFQLCRISCVHFSSSLMQEILITISREIFINFTKLRWPAAGFRQNNNSSSR